MNFFVTLQRPRQQIILMMRRYLRSASGSYLLNSSELKGSIDVKNCSLQTNQDASNVTHIVFDYEIIEFDAF